MKRTIYINPHFVCSVELENEDPFGTKSNRVFLTMINNRTEDIIFKTKKEAESFIESITSRMPTEPFVFKK